MRVTASIPLFIVLSIQLTLLSRVALSAEPIFEILHDFGARAGAALIEASDGNFYGTTRRGGDDRGTVFRMHPSGRVTTLHFFTCADGSEPSSLIEGSVCSDDCECSRDLDRHITANGVSSFA